MNRLEDILGFVAGLRIFHPELEISDKGPTDKACIGFPIRSEYNLDHNLQGGAP